MLSLQDEYNTIATVWQVIFPSLISRVAHGLTTWENLFWAVP